MANKKYDLDDFVCCECIEDQGLKAKIISDIVVFPEPGTEDERTFPLTFVKESAEVRAVEQVEYKSRKIGYYVFEDLGVTLDSEDLYGPYEE